MHTLGSSVRTAKASHGNKISFTSHIQSVDREGKDGSKGGEEEEDEDDVVIQQEAEKVAKVKRGQKTEQTWVDFEAHILD